MKLRPAKYGRLCQNAHLWTRSGDVSQGNRAHARRGI